MTDRENFLRIVRFDNPERVVQYPPEHSIDYMGCAHEGWDGIPEWDQPAGSKWHDIFGIGWRKELGGMMGMPYDHPLRDLAILDGYVWPDPDDGQISGAVYQKKAAFQDGDTFIAGGHRDTLWEKAYMLVGMDTLMVAFYEQPELVHALLDRIMDFQIGIAGHYLANGIEIAHLGDDLGTQTGLLLSPGIIKEFLAPRYKRLVSLYKQHGVLVDFHSCGSILGIVDLFLDIGIDILNPAQVTANNLTELRARTQGRITLQGGVPSGIVMSGPAERIDEAVHKAISLLGAQGGYLCSPDQGMPYPAAHLQAFQSAVEKWGKYGA